VDRLKERARELGCLDYLQIARDMASEPTGSVRQLAIYRDSGSLDEVVRRMLKESGLAAPVPI
jgi:hypothetical protein